jgi:hypothetical protein
MPGAARGGTFDDKLCQEHLRGVREHNGCFFVDPCRVRSTGKPAVLRAAWYAGDTEGLYSRQTRRGPTIHTDRGKGKNPLPQSPQEPSSRKRGRGVVWLGGG